MLQGVESFLLVYQTLGFFLHFFLLLLASVNPMHCLCFRFEHARGNWPEKPLIDKSL